MVQLRSGHCWRTYCTTVHKQGQIAGILPAWPFQGHELLTRITRMGANTAKKRENSRITQNVPKVPVSQAGFLPNPSTPFVPRSPAVAPWRHETAGSGHPSGRCVTSVVKLIQVSSLRDYAQRFNAPLRGVNSAARSQRFLFFLCDFAKHAEGDIFPRSIPTFEQEIASPHPSTSLTVRAANNGGT